MVLPRLTRNASATANWRVLNFITSPIVTDTDNRSILRSAHSTSDTVAVFGWQNLMAKLPNSRSSMTGGSHEAHCPHRQLLPVHMDFVLQVTDFAPHL